MKKSIDKNIVVIIQARTGSTRLPGEVLEQIEGKPMIWHVDERVKHAKNVDKIVLATTDSPKDDQLASLATSSGVECFRGSENDVLDRYYQAAKKYNADVVVRITGDCPVADPEIIDSVVDFFTKNTYYYVSTAYPKATYPDGLDAEVFTFSALEKAWKEASLGSEREHATPYIWKHTELFKVKSFENKEDLSFMRWTVDEEKDLKFIREVYKRLYSSQKIFLMQDILDLIKKEPALMDINQGITRNEGYSKSLKNDA